MKRTKIIVDRNYVTVQRHDQNSGDRTSTTYFVPATDRGGYVRIYDADGRYHQVCEKLCRTGSTLQATPENLAAVIRRELRRRAAAERKGA